MAKHDKDRVPGETLADSSAPGPRTPEVRSSVVGVCLWTAGPKRLDCRPSRNNSPLLGLVLDLIRSSGGLPKPENPDLLSAGFSDIASGLLCARRIQWAIEGLAEYEPFKGAVATILVDQATENPNREWPPNLGRDFSSHGRILLSPSLTEILEGQPSVALEAATAEGFRSWPWKTSNLTATSAKDEKAVLEIIQAAGRTDPSAFKAPPAVPQPLASVPVRDAQVGQRRPADRVDETRDESVSSGAGKSSRMPILVGAAAVLLVGIAFLFFFLHKSPVQSATPVQTAAPVSVTPTPEARPVKAEPHPKQVPARDSLTSKKTAKDEPLPPSLKPAESHCDLTAEEIQRSLNRAELYMHGGDLPSARAAFQHVLGCPSAREKAQEGLNRIQRMAASNQ
jgi:hypothetical protein